MKKKFISFEGPDGSGKTTAIKSLMKYLNKKHPDLDYVFTREPGGATTAEAIRKVILNKRNTDMDSEVEAFLYAAARRQHLVSTIWPALKAGKIVFCDRYIDSSLAYQGHARKLGISHVEKINVLATNNTWPDVTIYFNLSIKEAEKRVDERISRDRIESEGSSFRRLVHEGYNELLTKYKKRFIIIDASKSKVEVLQQIISIIESFI